MPVLHGERGNDRCCHIAAKHLTADIGRMDMSLMSGDGQYDPELLGGIEIPHRSSLLPRTEVC